MKTICEEVERGSRSREAVWAVVPIKRLCSAKQRLTVALGASREEFARLLAARTLDLLRDTGLFAGVIVVTPDPIVSAMARSRNARVVDDADSSLNVACALGLEDAARAGARLALVVPSDLALLSVDDLRHVMAAYSRIRRCEGSNSVGLVRCKEGTGTNLVVLDPRRSFSFAFGADSFRQHREGAPGRTHEITAPGVSFEVDSADDLAILAGRLTLAGAQEPLAMLVRSVSRSPSRRNVSTQPLTRATAAELLMRAAALRDQGYPRLVTYSRKVFLPLTQLCRDSCHYCVFAKAPRHLSAPYMTVDEVVEVAVQGAKLGCKEALFTLGERPELRYRIAREWLAVHGFASTLDYLAHAATAVRDRTGLLPHINAGCLTADEMAMLRPISASMGLMLESVATRLCERGGPHYGSPDKMPSVRLETLAEAGRQRVPFTTGILIGIGETREERLQTLQAIHHLHERFGHIQEVIVQNFVPKEGTKMSRSAAPDAEELLWTIAAARHVFGPQMSIQAPPNLSPAPLPTLIAAGINDWGGVSPLTPDYVNPEAPWPQLERLRAETEAAGKVLAERLTLYPPYAKSPDLWVDPAMRRAVLELSDGAALGREDIWRTGRSTELPADFRRMYRSPPASPITPLVVEMTGKGAEHLEPDTVAALFDARGADFWLVCEAADALRREVNGNAATYVINRNINYTNICAYRCTFCAFSKGTRKHEGAERPYLLDVQEVVRRSVEAQSRGATEVCLQGGIHPHFTGETYLEILRALKSAVPELHVHAFSPLEVWHGAETLGLTLRDFLSALRAEGLGSLPGTAAEILVDRVRATLCPDKLKTDEWLEVIETAHEVGLKTTATMMFGHIDHY